MKHFSVFRSFYLLTPLKFDIQSGPKGHMFSSRGGGRLGRRAPVFGPCTVAPSHLGPEPQRSLQLSGLASFALDSVAFRRACETGNAPTQALRWSCLKAKVLIGASFGQLCQPRQRFFDKELMMISHGNASPTWAGPSKLDDFQVLQKLATPKSGTTILPDSLHPLLLVLPVLKFFEHSSYPCFVATPTSESNAVLVVWF